MPFTGNPTSHYGFGQYLGTDKSSWYDNNQQFEMADTALFGVEEKAQTAQQTATAASGTADQANTAAVAAGTKADTVAIELANALNWTMGNFTNPNQDKFNTYTLSYKYNKKLGFLEIYGFIKSNTALVIGDILANLSAINGFISPINDRTLYNTGYGQGVTDPYTFGFLNATATKGGNLLFSGAWGTADTRNITMHINTVVSGWGTIN